MIQYNIMPFTIVYHHASPNTIVINHVFLSSYVIIIYICITDLWSHLLPYCKINLCTKGFTCHKWYLWQFVKMRALEVGEGFRSVWKSISGVIHIHSHGVEWKGRVHTWSCCHIISDQYIIHHILSYPIILNGIVSHQSIARQITTDKSNQIEL